MSDKQTTILHPRTPASVASWFFPHEPEEDDKRAALRQEIEALLAERAGWQPIETAPTNAPILIFAAPNIFTASKDEDGYWRPCVGDFDFEVDEEPPAPTHWMPLPELPRAS